MTALKERQEFVIERIKHRKAGIISVLWDFWHDSNTQSTTDAARLLEKEIGESFVTKDFW